MGVSDRIAARHPPIGRLVRLGRRRVHLFAEGPEDGLALVMLHGASGNLLDFAVSVMPGLAVRHRAVAMDRPGFGHSDPAPGDPASLGAQVAMLRAALHAIGIRRYALIGHSYGAALALDWAVRHPSEVMGLLAVSGGMLDWTGELGLRYRIGGIAPIGGLLGRLAPIVVTDARLDEELAEVFAPNPVPAGYVERAGVALALRPKTFSVNLRQMRGLWAETQGFLGPLERLSLPVEVVHGRADAIVPYSPDPGPTACAVPGAELEVLDGVGHMPHHAAPEAVIAAADRLAARVGVVSPRG